MIEYSPLALVTACFCLPSAATAVTVAPGMIAPFASVTCPAILPFAWPKAAVAPAIETIVRKIPFEVNS